MPIVKLTYIQPITGVTKVGCVFDPSITIDLNLGTVQGSYRNLVVDINDALYATPQPEKNVTGFVLPLPQDALLGILNIMMSVAQASGASSPSVPSISSGPQPKSPLPIEVSITTQILQVQPLNVLQLAVSVGNIADQRVAWVVLDDSGGTIDENGLYTAPLTPGKYRVAAVSIADPAKCAVAVINVN